MRWRDVSGQKEEKEEQERVTLRELQKCYQRDVRDSEEDASRAFATGLLEDLVMAVAEEPEIFVGTDPGYSEDWRELPYEKVLNGRHAELASLLAFQVYEEIEGSQLPADAKPISARFLYRMKPDGSVKARLVVQQVRTTAPGLSWLHTYATCPTVLGGRLVLWQAARKQWPIREGDVSSAFLHAPLDADLPIFVRPPACVFQGRYWKLRKALYGLRVAPRTFQLWYADQQKRLRLLRCKADPQLYYRQEDGSMHVTHADDVRLTAPPEVITPLQKSIGELMKIRWDRELSEQWSPFLGSQWRRVTNDHFQLRADLKHLRALQEMLKMQQANSVGAPAWSLQEEQLPARELDPTQASIYRSAVGVLQWLALVRPDLQYTSKELARGLCRPTTKDWARLRHAVRYCIGTADVVLNLEFDKDLPCEITVYCDSNFAGDVDTRKSTTGYLLLVQGLLLTSASKTQSVIALSSAEAELMALNSAVREALFARTLLHDILGHDVPIAVRCDSTACIAADSKEGLGKMRHIQTQYLWVQQLIKDKQIIVVKVKGSENPADILTKHLPAAKMCQYRDMIGLEYEQNP
ncbi:unnamed protein product [Polarella glacialis]|uniref:Reverse transcriptase Ty1/copia-type domain-containing protein n=1 Tax=Polarella glacialis TaxID=89957 RepID=A0A813LW44_POLGL|nr:unnamed protein product [Polarella glacialis]